MEFDLIKEISKAQKGLNKKQIYYTKKELETLHQYIIKAKLDLCKKLIEEGKSITDIAQICNLSSYNNLFRVFKKEFGITPKAYYNEIKKYK